MVFRKNLSDQHPAFLVKTKNYPHFYDDMFYDLLTDSIDQSIKYYKKLPPEREFRMGNESYSVRHLLKTLKVFKSFISTNTSTLELNRFISENFNIYKSTGKDNNEKVLFTGYYEPSLKGSLTKDDKFNVPVFAVPEDLVQIDLSLFTDNLCHRRFITGRYTNDKKIVPYYNRKEIGDGTTLLGKAKVLAWVDSKIDLFFLEIQGSGIIKLKSGGSLRVHYSGKNGREYRSIGRYLIDSGKIPKEKMSMQEIRRYLSAHPDEVDDILNYNSSYVFFRLENGGPYGCYNAQVVPDRSIATDKGLFPPCGLAFITTEKPLIDGDGNIHSWVKFSRFVLNQDTGGAIKGPGRADLFKGNGDYAETAAGHMQQMGEMYFLVLKKVLAEKK